MASLNRIVMSASSREMIRSLRPHKLDVAEISGGWGANFNFKTYEQYRYPRHDICAGPFRDKDDRVRKFDLIMANQVWEHLDRPYAATKNIRKMLRKGGHFWVAVPFFIPFHAAPNDCSRWSARGLKNLMIECGFDERDVYSEQWGNRHAAQRNLEVPWPPEYDKAQDPLDNDPEMPICAWALAQKS
ncbi:methyltransferase domain-containing protein [uncultured Shimia sp.]|uniref:class I SAM-dependent methyltransferase n=1 Tax=uncultured Shimia sp. TaxID=573152 RepID=UPI00260DA8BB|nr:methyltransferase domain-containing protein [uncultured Shimia sp.]